MNRDQVLAALRRHWQDIEQRFAIKHLSVFGSAARDNCAKTVILMCWWSSKAKPHLTATWI